MEQWGNPVYHIFMLKRIIIGAIVLSLLLLGAVLILPGLVPTDTYRDRLEADLSRVFARDVTISGDIDISTFPVLKVETGAISLSNPEGFPEGKFVDIDSMSAKIRLWPLLRKRVEISGVTLQSPTIRLEKQSDGQVNWAGRSQEETDETGPYKRDGRYTEYDPALALLRVANGTLTYADDATGDTYEVNSINLDLRAPGLDQALSIDGDLGFDGLDTTLNAEIKSPADFLKGMKTEFSAKIASSEGDINFTGKFLTSEDIAFTGDFDVNTKNPNTLAARFPLPEDYELPVLTSVSGKGRVEYDANTIAFPTVEADVIGDGINATFSGAVDLGEGSASAGQFSAKLDDMDILRPYLEKPVEALNVVSAVDVKANIKWIGSEFDVSNIQTSLSGPDLTAAFTGNAAYKSALSLNGNFEGSSDNFASLIETAGIPQADAAAVKRVSAVGTIALTDGIAKLSNVVATASEGLVNGQYEGDITFGDDLGLEGQFKGEISDLGALNQALPREIPYSDVVNGISLSSSIRSAPEGYVFTGLISELTDGLLNGEFKGQLTLGDASKVSGSLSLAADSLRAVASTQNITLPPSTDVGPILEAFSLSGQVSGTPEKLTFNSGVLKLDNLTGRGDFDMALTSAKPVLTGNLSINPMDLRPYMAAWSEQNPEGKILPWSEEQIILSGLNAMDAKVGIDTPSITLDRLALGVTTGAINLKNGVLSADLEKTKLYGGDASGSFSIASTNGLPTISVDATVKSVAAQNFFLAMGGFEKITGTSDLNLSFNGQGQTQADIMKSLTGDGVFNVVKGQLLGLDAGALLSGVDTALTQRQLPDGLDIGKTTDFNDINGTFSLINGRASLNGFQLQSGAFYMDADGAIDIGEQSIDVGLRPKLTTGSDLAQFGIPLRFTGGFGAAKPSLDTNLLGEIAKAKARQKAGNTIRDNLSGPLGGILGGVISGQDPETGSPAETEPVEEAPPAETNTPEADAAESESEDVETPEEQIGNALKDLFGRKKKD